MPEHIGYDVLLESRMRQLKEIDDRLERLLNTPNGLWDWESTKREIFRLRGDVQRMIQVAEAESAAF